MALLDDIKTALSISTDRRDSEISMFIDAALEELRRVGIDETILTANDDGEFPNALVKHAIVAYCKAHRGQDTPNMAFYDESFRRIAVDLANSPVNIAAIEQAKAESDADGDADGASALGAALDASAGD